MAPAPRSASAAEPNGLVTPSATTLAPLLTPTAKVQRAIQSAAHQCACAMQYPHDGLPATTRNITYGMSSRRQRTRRIPAQSR